MVVLFVDMFCWYSLWGVTPGLFLDDPGLLIRRSGVLALVVSFDYVSDFEVFLQLLKLIWSEIWS